ncbi:MAG: hypothetical protein WAU45_20520 [Blastocatellia bacterium]
MTNTIFWKIALRFCVTVGLASQVCFGQDWPQWRGPNRDGKATSFNPPKVWPDKLKIIWKVPVGIGYSSPVVVGRRVYLHSRQDENEVASCFDLESARVSSSVLMLAMARLSGLQMAGRATTPRS